MSLRNHLERKFDFSFGAHEDSELSITASVSRMESLEADDSAGAEPQVLRFSLRLTLRWPAMFTQPAESIGLSGLPHLRPALPWLTCRSTKQSC